MNVNKMILMMFLTFSIAVSSANASKREEDKTEKEKLDEYGECIKAKPCPNEGKSLNDLTDDEKHKTYHCRVIRHLECSTPPKEDNKL